MEDQFVHESHESSRMKIRIQFVAIREIGGESISSSVNIGAPSVATIRL